MTVSPTDRYTVERIVTASYLKSVNAWISETEEVFVVLRYLRAAGNKDYAFIRSEKEFELLVDVCPVGTDIIVFKNRQLPLRGVVNLEFIEKAKDLVSDGSEYMYTRLKPDVAGELRLFGEMGQTHAELVEDLGEEFGIQAAFGACPKFISADNESMISASKGGIDGPR